MIDGQKSEKGDHHGGHGANTKGGGPVLPAPPRLDEELKDEPETEKLCKKSRIHLHSHVTAQVKGVDDCDFEAADCVKCKREYSYGCDQA